MRLISLSLIDKTNYSLPTKLNNIYLDSLIGVAVTGMIIFYVFPVVIHMFLISKSVIFMIVC